MSLVKIKKEIKKKTNLDSHLQQTIHFGESLKNITMAKTGGLQKLYAVFLFLKHWNTNVRKKKT